MRPLGEDNSPLKSYGPRARRSHGLRCLNCQVSSMNLEKRRNRRRRGHFVSSAAVVVMEASSIAFNEDPNKSRRATRKAAAACLARQRHKSFVNGLQDQGSVLRGRIESLRRRRGHAVSAQLCAVARALDERIRTICCARGWTTVRPNPYTPFLHCPCAHHCTFVVAVPASQESAAAAYMMHRFGAVLGTDQFGQLKGWLRRCASNGLNAPSPPSRLLSHTTLSRPQLGARNADAAAPSSSTAAR